MQLARLAISGQIATGGGYIPESRTGSLAWAGFPIRPAGLEIRPTTAVPISSERSYNMLKGSTSTVNSTPEGGRSAGKTARSTLCSVAELGECSWK